MKLIEADIDYNENKQVRGVQFEFPQCKEHAYCFANDRDAFQVTSFATKTAYPIVVDSPNDDRFKIPSGCLLFISSNHERCIFHDNYHFQIVRRISFGYWFDMGQGYQLKVVLNGLRKWNKYVMRQSKSSPGSSKPK